VIQYLLLFLTDASFFINFILSLGMHINYKMRPATSVLYMTSYITGWSRLVLEKLTVPQLVTKFFSGYNTQRFITMSARASHTSLS